MFAENRHYGHAHLLLSYCGLSPRMQIPVRLQHGWQPGVGMRAQDMAQPGPKIVWSSRNLARANEAGDYGAVAIGAPWLYMPKTLDPGPDHPRSALIVPFHGWEQQGLAGSMDAYAKALVRLEASGFGPITVCLYWFEYEQPALREVFERQGFATTTMGPRSDNPAFLRRQRELIQRHAYVSSNRVSTASFYALEAGRPFFLYGPLAGLSATEDASGEQFDRWQRDEFPTLARAGADAVHDAALGAYELGAQHKRTPEQLREILLLGPEHRATRVILGASRRAHDIAGLLGLGRRR
jgi:hypothetical protein